VPKVSASALFHFTRSLASLENILTNGFRPRYCLEDLSPITGLILKEPLRIAFPLLSFCDIPLTRATHHMGTYGNFAIGLTKGWGRTHTIAPVFYAHDQGLGAMDLASALVSAFRAGSTSPAEFSPPHLSRMIKPYSGTLVREGALLTNYCFYDEREWRFIPMPTDILSESQFQDPATRDAANHTSQRHYVPIYPGDIRYIIVPSDTEVLQVLEIIQRVHPGWTSEQQKLLLTRVLTVQQIDEDF
jgi:hypothetical protein